MRELGISGEFAAQALQRRKSNLVHYVPPLPIHSETGVVSVPTSINERPLSEAVNDVLSSLGLNAPLSVSEIENIGFRLLFGESSFNHVGRGYNTILPIVVLGLFTDPWQSQNLAAMSVSQFRETLKTEPLLLLEEPEGHLHPKVQSRLAHWFVSLAMTGRRLMIETHSDHLVRRLRGLVARAGSGSELERWLLDNVAIVEVEQDETGCSTLRTSHLTATGLIAESWPADFMDEASDEDSAIFYAGLDKQPPKDVKKSSIQWIEGEEPEMSEAP